MNATLRSESAFYVVVRMSGESYVLVGPRGTIATSDERLTDAISDVPRWIHRDRPGIRKTGLRGWRTLDGVLRSKAWLDRAAEALKATTDTYRVEIAKLIEIGPPGHEKDALETVLTAPGAQGA
jgi:hypothetical protein